MSSPAGPPTRPTAAQRSLAPDVARGLMLALIALANVSWFLWGQDRSGMSAHVEPRGAVDSALQVVMTIAVDQRAVPLFAFLFGYGMVQFYRSRIDRGMEPPSVRRMLRRRHWAMLLLGFVHAALLFYGDILGAYAIAGLLLVWIFFGRRSKTLAIWSIVIASLMALWAVFSAIGGFAMAAYTPPEVLAEMEDDAGGFGPGMFSDAAYGQAYLPALLSRIVMWAFSSVSGALLIAPLPILLGWLAARRRLLDEPWAHGRLLRRVAIGGIAIGWLGGVPAALLKIGVIALPEAASWTFQGLTTVTGVIGGLGYAAAFGLLAVHLEGRSAGSAPTAATASPAPSDPPAVRAYGAPAADPATVPASTRTPGPVARALAAVGQRSLTFYLYQSLLMTPLMAGWALGLGEQLSTSAALGIALLVWLSSLPLAALLAARGLRGPAEVVLRRMIYGKHDPAARGTRRAEAPAQPQG